MAAMSCCRSTWCGPRAAPGSCSTSTWTSRVIRRQAANRRARNDPPSGGVRFTRSARAGFRRSRADAETRCAGPLRRAVAPHRRAGSPRPDNVDRKSTRLNSSHVSISYAVFCLKKKIITTVPRSEAPKPLLEILYTEPELLASADPPLAVLLRPAHVVQPTPDHAVDDVRYPFHR